jgi:hypothetical protein
MRQDQVLFVADPDFAPGKTLGQIGDRVHLLGGRVARRRADRLERHGDDAVARHAVLRDVPPHETREIGIARGRPIERGRAHRRRRQIGRGEIRGDARDFGGRQRQGVVPPIREFALDLGAELVLAHLVDQNLDPRLVFVVAPAVEVVDAQDRLAIGEQFGFRQKFAQARGQARRAAHAAARVDREAHPAARVAHGVQADVVEPHRRAIPGRAGHGDLEFAGQKREFGMQRRPLAQDFGVGPRIDGLVGGGAREMVGGDVADAIARGLDRVHLDFGEFRQKIGHARELDPVELQILAGGEMPETAVVDPRDAGEPTHLAGGQHAVGNGDAQHIGMELEIDAVHQPQRLELVFRHLARQAPRHLVPEFGDAFAHEIPVELVVAIHV